MVLYGCNIWHNQPNQRSLKSVSHCEGLPSSLQMHLKLPRDSVFVGRCKACVYLCRCAHTRKWKFKMIKLGDYLVLGRYWGHQVWNGSGDACSVCLEFSLAPCTLPHPLGCSQSQRYKREGLVYFSAQVCFIFWLWCSGTPELCGSCPWTALTA